LNNSAVPRLCVHFACTNDYFGIQTFTTLGIYLKLQQIGRFKLTALVTIAAVVLVVASEALLLGGVSNSSNELTLTSGWHTVNVVSGSMTVNAKGLTVVGLYVPKGALNAVLQGDFSATCNGTESGVMVVLLSAKDFGN
jgi:hypothetical protein